MSYQHILDLGLPIKIEFNQALSKYTYTQTGGPADVLAFPKTEEDLSALLKWVNENQVPLTILGNASNLIVRDGGIRGLVVILTEMDQMSVEGNQLQASAGAALIKVSRLAADHQLTGLEFACGIPGSIGGAIYMNAGAYGGEVADVIDKVRVMRLDGAIIEYDNKDCDFSYRHSIFQSNEDIVVGVVFKLTAGNGEEIEATMSDLTYQRESKQPLEYPSCGSVFKRPPGYFTGQLIQEAGLQGYRIGGVEVSRKHAGFMVNIDHGTATDYVNLIEHVKNVIWDTYQVKLEAEVRIIGTEVDQGE